MGILIGVILSPLIGVLALLLLLTTGLLYLPVSIFQWVISVPISFINEPVVINGFGIVRDFVNIFFVLALIAIGLATILRIEAYQWQKLLPKLIIAALLINFSPVICGVILDMSNIIMNIFKNSVLNVGETLVNNVTGVSDWIQRNGISIVDVLFNPKFTNIAIGFIAKLFAGILLNVTLFIVLFIYAGIFILRIAVIWILVILSPFAWLGFFFPPFKKAADMWWKQFIQWSIIGIPLFFFLYLTKIILKYPICQGALTVSGTAADWLSGAIICSILSTFFPIIFMIMGLFIGMQTGAMGASAITGSALAWGKKTGTNIGKGAWGRAKGWAIEKTPERWKETARKMAVNPALQVHFGGQEDRTAAGFGKRFAASWLNMGVKPLGATMQALGRGGTAITRKSLSDTVAKAEKEITEIKDKNQRLGRVRESGITNGTFTGRVLGAIKMGDVDDLNDVEIEKALKWAKDKDKDNSYKEFAKALPHLVFEDDDAKVDEEGLRDNALLVERAAYQIRRATNKESIPNWSEKMLNNHIVMRAFIEKATPSQLNAFLAKFKYKGGNAIQRTINAETTLGGDHHSLTRKEYVDKHTSLGKTLGKKNAFLKLDLS